MAKLLQILNLQILNFGVEESLAIKFGTYGTHVEYVASQFVIK